MRKAIAKGEDMSARGCANARSFGLRGETEKECTPTGLQAGRLDLK